MKRSGPRFFNAGHKTRQQPKTPAAERQPPLELSVEDLSHDGRGVARHRGKTVFVSHALPGETLRAHITAEHSRFDEAQCAELITASSHRTEPECRHYRHCGGCQLQHLAADQQIVHKQQLALDQLQRIAGIRPQVIAPPLDAGHWFYRRRSRISVYCPKQRSEPLMGFRRHQSKELVPIQHCPVLEQRAQPLIPALARWLKQARAPQAISHFELIMGDEDAALVARHPRAMPAEDINSLQQLCTQMEFQLLLQPQGPDSLHSPGTERLPGTEPTAALRLHYGLPEFGLQLAFHPSDFIQVNRELNRLMVSQAMQWLEPSAHDRILELFCGLGNFSLPMAALGAEVVAVEGSQAMVDRGCENARSNQLDNASFHCTNLNADFRHQPWFRQGFNKVLLDPPRAGAQQAIQQLQNYPIDTLLYISCDPATLARDSKQLTDQGYRLQRWGVMNMFPHTSHVESMALFIR